MQQLGAEKRLQPLLSRSLAQSRLCPGYCSPLLLSLLLSSFRNYLQAPALLWCLAESTAVHPCPVKSSIAAGRQMM